MTLHTMMNSPVGELMLTGEESAAARGGVVLTSLSFRDSHDAPGRTAPQAFEEVERQLEEYFTGARTGFDLDLAPGGTPFQERVWAALDDISFGTTTTYGRLAELVGAPRDRIRAVAAAIGANPLLIVRPCHRVVGADGSLTGYAGGVERKRMLLTHEGALQPLFA